MKRLCVCALILAGLACGNTTATNNGGGAGGGSTTAAATGGTSATTTDTSTATGGGGNTGGVTTTGGATATGGTTSTSTGGTTNVSAGGAAGAATGGTTPTTSSGGAAGTGAGGAATGGTTRTTSPGTGGAAGTTSSSTGGAAGVSTGGSAGGGGATVVATGPTAKDPETEAADLTKYYISSINGDDGNSGTSPDQAWASLGKIPRSKVAVFFEKGSKWTITVGGTSRSGLSVAAGSVYATYGTGDKPLIYLDSSDQKTTAMGAVQLGGNNLVDGLKVKGYAVIAFPVSSNNNVVQNCEVDGSIEGQEYGKMQLGFSISGQYNLIVGNNVHDLSGLSGDTGNVNTSGGSEAFVMNAGNNEVAYNTAVNCWVPNTTLNGAEGGCLEIIGNKAGELIENAFFHHNYCERSVGLFEACAGNFSGDGQKIQLNHAIVRNSTVSYNVAIDAMWLYLLQPVNTDFDGLYFEHNTFVHGPHNTDIPQGGAAAFGIMYDTDVVWTTGANPTTIPCTADTDCGPQEHCLDYRGTGKACQYQWKVQPGQMMVRNNLFVVLEGAAAAMMTPPPGPGDFINNIFSPKAPMGVTAGTGAIIVSDPGLVDTFYLAPSSPAVDKGDPGAFQPWVDWEGNKVPCGSAPDVGAVEYCP
jgi:hypothetical protein